MRFALALVVLALVALVGLFAFGLSLEPEARTIETEAVGVSVG